MKPAAVDLLPDNTACDEHLLDPDDYMTTCGHCAAPDAGPEADAADRSDEDAATSSATVEGNAAADSSSAPPPAANDGCTSGQASLGWTLLLAA